MRLYKQQHKYFCGVDLHARKIYVCIVDQKGKTKIHQNIKTDPDLFIKLISRYRKNVVVGVTRGCT
jgi:predicted NBD/HSP70 family sugar kinase